MPAGAEAVVETVVADVRNKRAVARGKVVEYRLAVDPPLHPPVSACADDQISFAGYLQFSHRVNLMAFALFVLAENAVEIEQAIDSLHISALQRFTADGQLIVKFCKLADIGRGLGLGRRELSIVPANLGPVGAQRAEDPPAGGKLDRFSRFSELGPRLQMCPLIVKQVPLGAVYVQQSHVRSRWTV